jgi:4-hydroxy-tetrahydrodipicolinate synthase
MSSVTPTYRGAYTALVTPLRNDRVDEAAFVHLVEEQIKGGIDGLIPVGTTGESATLSTEEHSQVIELAVQTVKGRVPVFAGTGSNSTREAIHLTQHAEKAGATGVLVVSPYYNKPTQAGLLAHYGALAESTSLPIIAYSIPGRTGMEIAVDTIAKLAEKHSNIVGLKESAGSIERFNMLRHALPDSFSLFSGDDFITLAALAVGADGVISVASNLLPGELAKMVRLFKEGKVAEAQQIHRRLYPLFRDLFIEGNPVPAKTALARQGWMTTEVRLPLVGLLAQNQAKLEGTLKALGL